MALAPADWLRLQIDPNIMPEDEKNLLQGDPHEPPPAAGVEDALVRLQPADQFAVDRALRARAFEAPQLAHFPPQVQRREMPLAVDQQSAVVDQLERSQ